MQENSIVSVTDYFKEVKKQRSETTKSAVSINYETLALQQAREQAAIEARRIREEEELLLNARQRVQEAPGSDSEEERVVDRKAKKAKKDKKRERSSSSSSSSSHDLSEPKDSKKAKKERSPSAEQQKDKKKEKKKDKKHKKHHERS